MIRGWLYKMRWPITGLALVGLGLMVTLGMNPQWVRVERIEIAPSESTASDLLFERIQASLLKQLKIFEGKYFWQVPLQSVFEQTMKDKRIKDVAIYRQFPSKLKLEIQPRTPVLAFLAGDGRLYPVAADATLLPALPVGDAPDLPIVRGEDMKDEARLREMALQIYEQLPEDGGLSTKMISEIVYNKKDGFTLFVNQTAAEIKVGDADFGPKLSRVQKVLAYLDSRGIKGRVIDARFSKKVLVRVRNTP